MNNKKVSLTEESYNNNFLKIVKLPNDIPVLDLRSENDRDLVIVDMEVIQRLASLLTTSSLEDIKRNLFDNIEITRTIESLTEVLENEIAFQRTVNILCSITKEQIISSYNNYRNIHGE